MEAKTFLAIALESPGQPRLIEIPVPELESAQVLVRMSFSQIINSIKNGFFYQKPKEPSIVGLEGSGVVEKIGSQVPSNFLGMKVACGLNEGGVYGTWAQYYVGDYRKMILVSEDISLEEASGLITNPVSVLGMIDMLCQRNMRSAAIYPATSQIGKQFGKLAEKLGVTVINIVRNEARAKQAEEEFKMANVIAFDDPDFKSKYEEMCVKFSVKLAFESVSGSATMKILNPMPEGSTVCCFGSLESHEVKDVSLEALLQQNKTICGFLMKFYLENLGEGELNRIHHQMIQKNFSDCFNFTKRSIFHLKDFEKAIKAATELKGDQKVILQLD